MSKKENTNNHSSILELTKEDAKEFFMKSESYSNLDLPPYFVFDKLLEEVFDIMNGKEFSSFQLKRPNESENVNYILFNNKDGKYAWRPIQLIHPAIYVSLVNSITEHWDTIKSRFKKFSKNKKIKCLSIPIKSSSDEKDKAEQISKWFQNIEQKSIELALDFEYIFHTDIENCYGSIYTHSIAWALHTKEEAKKRRKCKKLIGNIIDKHIQAMNYGQTNGIPQGSVLMDFIAEMILGYADLELSKKIEDAKIEDYFILRYRDDFRIFVNNPQDGERILKLITEVMIDLGMKLNSQKTVSSNDVIRSSIKVDKLHWLEKPQTAKTLQKYLLIIHHHSHKFPNSSSLNRSLSDFYKKRLEKTKKIKESKMPMISIVVDIALQNPKVYPVASAILSKLISFLDDGKTKKEVCKKIEEKFQKIPNTEYMQIWLQRISLFFNKNTTLDTPLYKLVLKEKVKVWNNDWIKCYKLKICLENPEIIDHELKDKLSPVIPSSEIELFIDKYY